MGTCKSQPVHILVPLPETPSGFAAASFGDENVLICVEALLRVCQEHPDRLCSAYVVEASPGFPRHVVMDPALEVVTVHSRMIERLKAGHHHPHRGGSNGGADSISMQRRAEHALCFMNLHVLKYEGLLFSGTLDESRIHTQLVVPLKKPELEALLRLFETVDKDRLGAVRMAHLNAWLTKKASLEGVGNSVFAKCLLNMGGQTTVTGALDAHEFIIAVHALCIASDEDLMEHAFFSLAIDIPATGPAIDVSEIIIKNPGLLNAEADHNFHNLGLLRTFQQYLSTRQASMSLTDFRDHGALCLLPDFGRLCASYKSVLLPLFNIRATFQQQVLGPQFWEDRQAQVSRALSQSESVPRTIQANYQVVPRVASAYIMISDAAGKTIIDDRQDSPGLLVPNSTSQTLTGTADVVTATSEHHHEAVPAQSEPELVLPGQPVASPRPSIDPNLSPSPRRQSVTDIVSPGSTTSGRRRSSIPEAQWRASQSRRGSLSTSRQHAVVVMQDVATGSMGSP